MAQVIEELSACCLPDEDEDDGSSDSALKAFLHGVAVESSTGVSHGPAAPSRGAPSPAPAASSGLSTAAGSTLAPAVPRTRPARTYLLVGGMAMAAVVLAGLLAVVLWPAKPAGPGHGTLALEGPLDQVQVAARHEQESDVRFLQPDAQGHIELREGAYRLALARGYEQYRLVPNRVTIAPGARVTVQIQKQDAPPLAVAPFDAAQAKRHQQAWADYLGLPVEWENSIGMKFVLIPPGEFMMGSTEEEVAQLLEDAKEQQGGQFYIDRLPSEAPRHHVRITKPFWLGATEVTQAQYQRIMGSNPRKFQGDPNRPVEQVCWNDCVDFCRRLSELPEEKTANRHYELPTEAQWEYACRAGNPGRRWFSAQPNPLPKAVEEELLGQSAWFMANAGGKSHPVGQLLPNPWGLFDIYGNVWELSQDWYGSDYYANSPTDNPGGPGARSHRVARGGGWDYTAGFCRSAFRGRDSPGYRLRLGFRVACSVDASSR